MSPSPLSLRRLHVSSDLNLSVSLYPKVQIENKDFFFLAYKSIVVEIRSRGKILGFVKSEGGMIRARDVTYIDAEMELDSIRIVGDVFYFIKDMSTGVLPLDTVTDANGDLSSFFLELPVDVHILPMEVMGYSTFALSMLLLKWLPIQIVDRTLLFIALVVQGDTSSLGLCRPLLGPLEFKSKTGKTPVLDIGTLAKIKPRDIKADGDNDILPYWLSNTSALLCLLQRNLRPNGLLTMPSRRSTPGVSGKLSQALRTPLQIMGSQNSDSFVDAKYPAILFKQQLTACPEKIFGLLWNNLKNELSPLLSHCIQSHLSLLAKCTSRMLQAHCFNCVKEKTKSLPSISVSFVSYHECDNTTLCFTFKVKKIVTTVLSNLV